MGGHIEAAELLAVALERVARDVEAERLLLAHERLARDPTAPRVGYSSSVAAVRAGGARLSKRPNRGRLPALAILARAARPLEGAIDRREGARARDAARRERGVERAALDERLDDALVHAPRVDALSEVERSRKAPPAARASSTASSADFADAAHRARARSGSCGW